MQICHTPNVLNYNYTLLSLKTHPSNVSVFQFGPMYIKGGEYINMKLALQLAQWFLSFFIRDYCFHSPSLIATYSKSPPLLQCIVNSCNRGFRGDEYALNQIEDQFIN